MNAYVSRLFQKAKNALHVVFPLLGALRYGIPGNHLEVIGITGTDGKSSSVVLTAAMLRAAGHRVAHFSSISFHDGLSESSNSAKMTTPGRMRLHAFLRTARENGCSYAVIEVTSQGILQHRHRLIGFSLIGITNITPEHIEAHGGFEPYTRAKLSLVRAFRAKNRGLVIDATTYDRVRELIPRGIQIHAVHRGARDRSHVAMEVTETSPFNSAFVLRHGEKEASVQSRLGGPFVLDNILFAATIASLVGVSLADIRDAVQSFACIPGRFEIVSEKPLVIVDYAHTLNALGILLPYVRRYTHGKLVHVFGAAGGGRDRYKRPLIARLSEDNADTSILTEENSFDEPVEAILADIKNGFTDMSGVHEYPHREDAVAFAKRLLRSPDDTLLLTAKGSEEVIAGPQGSRRPYTERIYTRCLFETHSSA